MELSWRQFKTLEKYRNRNVPQMNSKAFAESNPLRYKAYKAEAQNRRVFMVINIKTAHLS